jgi:hypothetical protein
MNDVNRIKKYTRNIKQIKDKKFYCSKYYLKGWHLQYFAYNSMHYSQHEILSEKFRFQLLQKYTICNCNREHNQMIALCIKYAHKWGIFISDNINF